MQREEEMGLEWVWTGFTGFLGSSISVIFRSRLDVIRDMRLTAGCPISFGAFGGPPNATGQRPVVPICRQQRWKLFWALARGDGAYDRSGVSDELRADPGSGAVESDECVRVAWEILGIIHKGADAGDGGVEVAEVPVDLVEAFFERIAKEVSLGDEGERELGRGEAIHGHARDDGPKVLKRAPGAFAAQVCLFQASEKVVLIHMFI
jgi:hypothetical protein